LSVHPSSLHFTSLHLFTLTPHLNSLACNYIQWMENVSWIERVKNGEVLHKVTKDVSDVHTVKRSKSN